MASATFENSHAVETVRAAIHAGSVGTRAAVRRGESGSAQTGGATRRCAPPIRVPALWRGVGASVAIASSYVAFVAAIRWLLLLA